MIKETWMPISNFYSISDMGRVRSEKRKIIFKSKKCKSGIMEKVIQ